jgi:hypothetical protein
LIEFEYMKENHTKKTLTKVVEKILIKHNIQARILIIITDNAFNNIIFFLILIKNLNMITSCVNVIWKKKKNDEMNDQNKTRNIVHVSCLAHVLQLTLQAFLNSIKINSINDELQKNWNDQENIRTIHQIIKELFTTLTKIILFKNICNNFYNNLSSFDRVRINFFQSLNS